MNSASLPRHIFSGLQGNCHVQGIAIDTARKYMYFSFTTSLVKTDLNGNLIGSVTGLLGHLGCIAFNDRDGRVYGSLEYKHDCIGTGILRAMHQESLALEEAFYCAVFDVNRITRPNMDAEKDGIMTAVYLRDVVADYCAEWTQNDTLMHHRYGCSGIDGISFGPEFGAPSDSKSFLNIAYGIYGDVNRTDNDHQVIVHYDITHWAQWAQPLRQEAMHRSGPAHCDAKYFIYTGNTEFGVQNLEYDPFTGNWLMCVYRGKKPQFPNAPMYIINGAAAPEELPLRGQKETGKTLRLWTNGQIMPDGVCGWPFPLGSTGVIALGDGYYYFCKNGRRDGREYGDVNLYCWNAENPALFEPVN